MVIADEQRQGRGRKGRLWYTPPGVALALSVVLRPQAQTLGRVSMLGALAVAESSEQLGLAEVGIKWPNDVQLNGLKVCGILPEAIWQGSELLGVVLGVGVNVRVQFDGPLAATATSLEPALGQPINRARLAAQILERVDHWAAMLGSAAFFEAWQQRLTTIGQHVHMSEPEAISGLAEGVDPDGALRIRDESGQVHRVVAGDVMFN